MTVRKKNLFISVVILTIVIMVGLLMTALVVDYGKREYRRDLLYHASIAAANFRSKQITNLACNSNNGRKNGCEPIRVSLQKIQWAIPELRRVYLMHMVGNQLRYLADTADPPGSDYSGDNGICAAASSELRGIFFNRKAILEGPVGDKSGEWVSAVAPIIDPQDGKVVAVLGLDIDAVHYHAKIAAYRGFGMAVTFLLGLLALTFQISAWRIRSSRDRLAALNLSLTEEIAGRKRAESSQQQQLHFLQILLDAIPCPIFYRDTRGIYLGSNEAFESFLGKTKAEIVGQSVHDLFPRQLADKYQQADSDLLEQGLGGIQTYESTIAAGDGKPHEMILYNANFPTMDGNLGGLIGTIIDISPRKEMERALRESETLFRSIFTNSAAGVVMVTTEGGILKANPAFCQFLGYSAVELERMGHIGVTHPDDLEASLRLYRDVAVDKPERFENEIRYVRKDGAIVWGQITGSWVYDADRNPIHAVVLVLDITERKQVEQALKKSEQDYKQLYQEFQALLNAMPETIMLIAPDMKVVWANQGALQQFHGCGAPQGRHCFNAWQGLEKPCRGCPVQRCFESGKNEEALLHDDVGRTWAVRAFPLKDEQGRVINVIDMASDISEKIRMRAEADRNSRLASLGELAAGVAHEINNPNGLILLNTPMLQDVFNDAAVVFEHYYQQHGALELAGLDYQELRDEVPLMLRRIQGGAVRIKRIVEDLKNFVRQGSDDLTEQMDLNEAARAAIRLVDNTVRKSTDHFESSFGSLAPGQGDFQRIEQVVVNLVQNACQALHDQGGRIRVVTYFDAEKNCNVLEVEDEGEGIDPELLSRVTDPFYTTKRQQGGTGLGLSISARIIRAHGGHLEIQSEPGAGTVVKVELPIVEEEGTA